MSRKPTSSVPRPRSEADSLAARIASIRDRDEERQPLRALAPTSARQAMPTTAALIERTSRPRR